MNFTDHKRTSVRHKIGLCPACTSYVWGNVEIMTTVSPPTLTADGKASVYANARPVAMQVEAHDCDRERDIESPFVKAMSEVFGTSESKDAADE